MYTYKYDNYSYTDSGSLQILVMTVNIYSGSYVNKTKLEEIN